MARDDFERRSARLNVNLRQSVNSARALSFAVGEMSGKFNGAVNAAGALAENLAKASRSARIAASATGIGALVAVLATIGVAAFNAAEKVKQVAKQTAEVRKETEILNAKAAGDKRKEVELEIALSMERELDAAKELESIFQKFPDLQDAIRAKAEAAQRAATEQASRARELAVGGLQKGFAEDIALQQARRVARDEKFLGSPEARAAAYFEFTRGIADIQASAEEFQLAPGVVGELTDMVQKRLDEARATIEFEAIRPFAMQLGDSLAGGIADGISEAIASGSIADGFRALTGAVLAGIGGMLQEIGARGLAASQLVSKLAAALASLDGGTGVAASLGLIALGGVLKGLGASMAGRGSRGSAGAGAGSSFNGSTIIDRGLISPLGPAPNITGLRAAQSVQIGNLVLLSPDDPRWQRDLLTSLDKARGRREG